MRKPDSLKSQHHLDELLRKLDNGVGFTAHTANVNEQITRKAMKEAADVIRFMVQLNKE
jgi:hypothetical protein